MDWDRVGYVVRSRHRLLALQHLQGPPLMPSVLAKRLNVSISHASQLLAGLVDKGLVRCLNPGMTRGRLYTTTPSGKEVLDSVRRRT